MLPVPFPIGNGVAILGAWERSHSTTTNRPAMTTLPIVNNLNRAEKIGSRYQSVSLRYCSADNTYEEVPVIRIALACPIR